MRRLLACGLVAVFFAFFASSTFAEEASQAVKDLAQQKLAAYGTDPVIVDAVKKQNAMGRSLDEIKKMDKEWQDTPGISTFMDSLFTSALGKHLAEIRNSAEYFSEIFVMDNLGANVAMSDKTSDFWQGDEAKFIKSFADGAGAVFVDDVEFDDSSQIYSVQISVPVMDDGKAIGSITFGIDVDKVE